MTDNHRVVAYAYDEYAAQQETSHGTSETTRVIIYIYDPNYPNDDEVYLSFYTHCKSSWIGLTHSKNSSSNPVPVHGFLKDDLSRSYKDNSSTFIKINSCENINIISASLVECTLKFSWGCKFIPYFCLQVNNSNWSYNSSVKSQFPPSDRNIKQLQTTSGSQEITLKLPRAISTVTVRFLEDDQFSPSVTVDAKPVF